MLRTAEIEAVLSHASRLFDAGDIGTDEFFVVQSWCSRARTADFEAKSQVRDYWLYLAALRCEPTDR